MLSWPGCQGGQSRSFDGRRARDSVLHHLQFHQHHADFIGALRSLLLESLSLGCMELLRRSDNPCSTDQFTPKAHAGLSRTSARNKVFVSCTDGAVFVRTAIGDTAISDANNAAQGHPGCAFIVAPAAMPIFGSPFPAGTLVGHTNGFDFARAGLTFDVTTAFGQPHGSGGAVTSIVDHFGKDKTGYVDEHDGHDWQVQESN